MSNTNNKCVEFELANIDIFIICVGFGLTNINTTHEYELSLLPRVLKHIHVRGRGKSKKKKKKTLKRQTGWPEKTK